MTASIQQASTNSTGVGIARTIVEIMVVGTKKKVILVIMAARMIPRYEWGIVYVVCIQRLKNRVTKIKYT
jgi:hypothetical protein